MVTDDLGYYNFMTEAESNFFRELWFHHFNTCKGIDNTAKNDECHRDNCMVREAVDYLYMLLADDTSNEPDMGDYFDAGFTDFAQMSAGHEVRGSRWDKYWYSLMKRPDSPYFKVCHHPTKHGHDPIAGCAGSGGGGDYVVGKGYCGRPTAGATIAEKAIAADGSRIELELNHNPSDKTYCNAQGRIGNFPHPDPPLAKPAVTADGNVAVGPPSMCLTVESDPFLGGACTTAAMWCPIPVQPMWSTFGITCGGYMINRGP
jgi:hypothetical protein